MLSLPGSKAMKMKTGKPVLLFIAMLPVSAGGGDWVLAQSSGPATQNPPVRRALLIGINKYKGVPQLRGDRKSTRLNSSHGYISYAVFCLKKKKRTYSAHRTVRTK